MPHKRAKKSLRDSTRKSSGYNRVPSNLDEMDEAPKGALRILNSMQVQADYSKRKREGQLDAAAPKVKKAKAAAAPSAAAGPSAYEQRRGTTEKGADKKGDAHGLSIQDGESLAHFNRRVEDSLRSSVAAASRKATATTTAMMREEKAERVAKHEARTAKKAGTEEDGDDVEDVAAQKAAKAEASRARAEEALQRKRDAVALDFAPKRSSSAPKRLNDIVQAPPQLTLPRLSTKLLAKKKDGDTDGAASKSSAYGKLGLSPAQARILEEERERVIRHYREMKARREYKPQGDGDN